MNSYEKLKRKEEIYKLMRDNIEYTAREMINDPGSYIPTEYAETPKVTEEAKTVIKEAARMILDEIVKRMSEIYRL